MAAADPEPQPTAQLATVGGSAAVAKFNLWDELRVLICKNLLVLVLSSGALVLAAVLQVEYASKFTAELGEKVMQYELNTSPNKRQDLLDSMWLMLQWQGVVQALHFVGGSMNKLVTIEIRKSLQLLL